jgi:hypothetical protein
MADELSNLEPVLPAGVGMSQVGPLPEDHQDDPTGVTPSAAKVQDFVGLRQHFLRVAVHLIDVRHLDDEEMEKRDMKKMTACVGCNCLQESGLSEVLGWGVAGLWELQV